MSPRPLLVCALLAACSGSSSPHEPRDAGDADTHTDAGEDPRLDGGAPPADAGEHADGGTADEDAASGDAGVDPADERLFDPLHARPRIDLTVSAEAEASLRTAADSYVEATFTLSDDQGTVGPLTIGLRGKGRYGSARTFDEKMAFKLDFNRVVAKQKLFGLGKLNLNNMVQDPSCLHEWMAYRLFASQGVPAPRTGYARVFVNGQEFGFYLLLEATDDGAFLKRHFASTNVVYEGEYGEDLFEGAEAEFDEDAGEDLNRVFLRAVSHGLASTPADAVYTGLANVVDWDEVLAAMATEVFIGHWDGYAPTRNNYFLHFDEAGRMALMPWGTDQTFAAELGLYEGNGLVLRACVGDAACRAAYGASLGRVSDAAAALLANDLDELSALANAVKDEVVTDPRFPHDPGQVLAYVNQAVEFLRKRTMAVGEHVACLNDPAADVDGDGYKCGQDCADGDATRHPHALEVCGDAIDQDCSGRLDDAEACPSCTEDTVLGATYRFCHAPRNYADAQADCAAQGGALVKLTSAAQASAVAERGFAYFAYDPWWLGLNDLANEGTFVWSDGTSAGVASAASGIYECGPNQTGARFCDFAGGEPNDYNASEDCITVSSDGGHWNDLYCDAAQPYVCRVP